MKWRLIMLIILLSQQGVAQHTPYQRQIDSVKWAKSTPLSLSVEPLAIVDYSNLAYRIGIELPIGHQVGLQLGFIGSTGGQGNDVFRGWSGYGIRAGVRKYFCPNVLAEESAVKFSGHWYIMAFRAAEKRNSLGAEFCYRTSAYSNTDSLTNDHRLINFQVSKETYTLNFTYSHTVTYRSGIFVQAFVGIGIRMKTAMNTASEEEERHFYHWENGNLQEITDDDCYKAFFPTLPAGFRIGYRFR